MCSGRQLEVVGVTGLHDDTLIMVMFRHALRVSEAIALHWEQVDLKQGLLYVNRLKNSLPFDSSAKRRRITRVKGFAARLSRHPLSGFHL